MSAPSSATTLSKAKIEQMRKELESVEAAMAELEEEKIKIEGLLCNPQPPEKISELGKLLNTTTERLAKLEIQWLTLGESLQ